MTVAEAVAAPIDTRPETYGFELPEVISGDEIERRKALRHEPFNEERCYAAETEPVEEGTDPEEVPQHLVTEVVCTRCNSQQPTPTRDEPRCRRCGVWLLANEGL
jgi:ribosomal protein L40E